MTYKYNPFLDSGFQFVLDESNYPEVATYADLPVASTVTGQIYYVDTGTGSLWTFNRDLMVLLGFLLIFLVISLLENLEYKILLLLVNN
jgi:hypothetical protein